MSSLLDWIKSQLGDESMPSFSGVQGGASSLPQEPPSATWDPAASDVWDRSHGQTLDRGGLPGLHARGAASRKQSLARGGYYEGEGSPGLLGRKWSFNKSPYDFSDVQGGASGPVPDIPAIPELKAGPEPWATKPMKVNLPMTMGEGSFDLGTPEQAAEFLPVTAGTIGAYTGGLPGAVIGGAGGELARQKFREANDLPAATGLAAKMLNLDPDSPEARGLGLAIEGASGPLAIAGGRGVEAVGEHLPHVVHAGRFSLPPISSKLSKLVEWGGGPAASVGMAVGSSSEDDQGEGTDNDKLAEEIRRRRESGGSNGIR